MAKKASSSRRRATPRAAARVRRSSSTSAARTPASSVPAPTATAPTATAPSTAAGKPAYSWTFLTNYSHVLILLSRDPSLVLREVAAQVGITERAVQRIIADLEAEGFLEREKIGRQNRYRIRTTQRLRHPIESHRCIGDLVRLVNESV